MPEKERQHTDREDVARFAFDIIDRMDDDQKLELRHFGGRIIVTLFVDNDHKHIFDHVMRTWRRTGRCLEFDYCFSIVCHLLWSDILDGPVILQCREVSPKELNIMVKRGEI